LTGDLHTGRYRIEPGREVHFNKFDPEETSGFEWKDADERDESKKLNQKLRQLQEMLYAEHKMKVLVILQAVDTGGKDGVIHRVFEGVNPQGVQVAHFGVPTPEELDHDFLWRHHKRVPGRGELVIFNRSHYEGVLVERVHKLVPEEVWKRRYREINDFERLLSEEETVILKFYRTLARMNRRSVYRSVLKILPRNGSSVATICRSENIGTSTWWPTRMRLARLVRIGPHGT